MTIRRSSLRTYYARRLFLATPAAAAAATITTTMSLPSLLWCGRSTSTEVRRKGVEGHEPDSADTRAKHVKAEQEKAEKKAEKEDRKVPRRSQLPRSQPLRPRGLRTFWQPKSRVHAKDRVTQAPEVLFEVHPGGSGLGLGGRNLLLDTPPPRPSSWPLLA
ncbi:hypothetical protein LX32DRAFT_657431 [Colletotrichum zoysiae]|uniref:Uncharacterized protein n=1 Tax=Colletotrichum zoysiae TaxID=1216348 RepID=A0AAD9LUQ1_9PEZI|nr:hypothetical protein LX32DRAFT_657431 [Colletotrichum zoysiae]